MSTPHRLVNLPGYDDSSRDIYETPDPHLTDDTTTASTTLTQRTSFSYPSSDGDGDTDSASSNEDDEAQNGVRRRRIHPAAARSKFAGVETRGGRNVDLSDRVDGRRKGYRLRQRRGKRNGSGEGEEGEEGLEARIARLRREIEECKVEAESELDFGGRDEEVGRELEGLVALVGGIDVAQSRRRGMRREGEGGDVSVERGGAVAPGAWPSEGSGEGEISDEQILRRVADFDARLVALEQALGISALDSATLDPLTTPILPSLTLLDSQMAALNSATSLTNLETAASRIQKLRLEAETLSQSQSPAQPSRPGTGTSNPEPPPQSTTLTPEESKTLQSLYSLLPTLHSLSPTLSPLLSRLRSLRALHTSAATAASELEEMETRQGEMEKELLAWRTGLEKVEGAVREAQEGNGRNGGVVEGWVRELEKRVKGL